MKLQTKLRHVNIYLHWLRQKVQHGSMHIWWIPTKEMIANGLTKALSSAQKHNSHLRMTGIKNQKDLLASIKRKKEAFQQLQIAPE